MISINICRISADRTKLEFNVETLSNYRFVNLYVWSYTDDDIWTISEDTIDLGSNFDNINNKEIKQLNLEDINLDSNTLYYLQFTVEWDGTGSENEDAVLYTNAAVADLYQTYYTKVQLLNNINDCNNNSDKVIQLYIYENCFKSALQLERWEDANYYFGLIKNATNNNLIVTI